MNITYDEGVFEELVNLSAYIAERNEPAAHAFLDACDKTFQLLAENRYLGSPGKFERPELAEVRMWRVKGFQAYLIFYTPNENGVKILHILHGARDYGRLFDPD